LSSGNLPRASELALTPAKEDDFESLAALRILAMRESLEKAGRFDAVRARERLRAGFSPAHTRHIEMAQQRIGFVVVKPDGDQWLLDHLYIMPTHQRLGVGSVILGWIFAEADAAGKTLRVGALRGSPSNRFYLRHGFVPDAETEFDNYYLRSPFSGVTT
jgi:GNAT superfamily N-acetyltransferase